MSMLSTPEMCFFCFDTVVDHLDEKNRTEPRRISSPSLPRIPNHESALFVTWKIRDHELRGCIGTHGAIPLQEGLKNYALYSGFQDPRFKAITEEEIPHLSCTVSLLYDFEPILDCYGWNIGEHGVQIEFHDKLNKKRSATYLPEVALEQGWDQKQTLSHLIQKAGCKDSAIFDSRGYPLVRNLRVVRYRSSVTTTHFRQYLEVRGESFFTGSRLESFISIKTRATQCVA
eukprot:TRINITY_DN2833_c0_g1_i2.p1 TRINITY_DN2833_c0_g1~~TRINITY_DN2833_c0_g1_i2.p1  ORF type:complete len:230 (+),score=24.16 TRINITY_DN2833_c0_g1_i2:58-747(+)